MRESVADRGSRYLLEGRVVVEAAGAGYFTATVRGAGDIHLVSYARGGWSCSCPARSTCAHLHAARLIAAPAYARLIQPTAQPEENR